MPLASATWTPSKSPLWHMNTMNRSKESITRYTLSALGILAKLVPKYISTSHLKRQIFRAMTLSANEFFLVG